MSVKRKVSGEPPELLSDPLGPAFAHSDIGPNWLQLALVVALVAALAIAPVALLFQLDPAGPWRLMPLFALVVACESVLTRRWLDWPVRRRQQPAYSVAELIVLLAMAPLFLWLAGGQLPLPSSAAALFEDPLALFSMDLALYMVLALLAWHRAHSWSGIFIKLSITWDEVRYYGSTPVQRLSDRSLLLPVIDRTALLNGFVSGWLAWGIFLVVVVALSTIDLRADFGPFSGPGDLRTLARLGLRQDLLLGLLVYFLGGLWLISQGRMVVLKGRWLANYSRRDAAVSDRWRRWAFFSILLLAFFAALLPIGSTLPLYRFLQAFARALTAFVSTLTGLLALLFYHLVSLLPQAEAPTEPPPPFEPGQLLRPEQLPESPPELIPPFLPGAIFWLALIAVTALAAVHFLSDRGVGVPIDRLAVVWRSFIKWLLGLGRDAAGLASSLVAPLRQRVGRPLLFDSTPSPFRSLRIGALPPREQIRFLYLSLIRQSGKRGVPRPPASTPAEFAQDLKSEWPDDDDEIDTLTAAFLKARYGAHDMDQAQLRSAKDAWLRIRRSRATQSGHKKPGANL